MGKRGWKKWVAFGDNHGNLTCTETTRALVKFIGSYKPDEVIHVGDCFDLPALRSGISREDSAACDDLENDLLGGFQFLERVQPTAYLIGNHEHRLWRCATEHSNGVVRMAADSIIDRIREYCRKNRIALIPYHYDDGVHRIADGGLTFVHGYTANQHAVSQHATHFGGGTRGSTVIMGHLHRVEYASGKRHSHTHGWSIGCMADFQKMKYASHRLATAAWENAWAYGVYRGSQHTVWIAKRADGKFMLPTGVEEF